MDLLKYVNNCTASEAKSVADTHNYKSTKAVKELEKVMKAIKLEAQQGGYCIRWVPVYNSSEEFSKLLTRLGYKIYNINVPKGCVEISWEVI